MVKNVAKDQVVHVGFVTGDQHDGGFSRHVFNFVDSLHVHLEPVVKAVKEPGEKDIPEFHKAKANVRTYLL